MIKLHLSSQLKSVRARGAMPPQDVDGQFGEDTSIEVQKIKREDLPGSIWSVCD